MLPTQNRMRHASDFRTALRGRRAGRSTLVAYLGVAPGGSDSPRVGFIVSRAVGGATTRNRVKRQLRHLVRPGVERLPAGSLLVIRALPAAAVSADRLGKDVEHTLGKLVAGATGGGR